MSKKNIMVIGAGQLGSRHLQGLAKSEESYTIVIVDPNSSNLETAISRFKEIEGYERHDLFSYKALTEIPNRTLDVVIIATNADIRAMITKQLVELFDVRNIIFEKVAFQSENQFLEIIELLQTKKTKSWVNCPRRNFPIYQKLKEYLKEKGSINLKVDGVEWGLACNSVHQIDLLAYLSGEFKYTTNQNKLDHKIYPSKRDGFIEFYGSFSGESISGNSFTLTCNQKKEVDEKPYQKLVLITETESIIINEGAGKVEFIKTGMQAPYKEESFNLIYQSSLTNVQVAQILNEGKSFLPALEESYQIHKPLLKILKAHYQNVTGTEIELLSIT